MEEKRKEKKGEKKEKKKEDFYNMVNSRKGKLPNFPNNAKPHQLRKLCIASPRPHIGMVTISPNRNIRRKRT